MFNILLINDRVAKPVDCLGDLPIPLPQKESRTSGSSCATWDQAGGN